MTWDREVIATHPFLGVPREEPGRELDFEKHDFKKYILPSAYVQYVMKKTNYISMI